ncbi:hypothetical protein D9753_34355 [Streptomyces dangxiongensis]|uniref:Immunity protein 49 n=2 Tax=Streptomyces dangxiongensis TaxID=1442032 RepID=A0A3G2JQC9_9ACTN|nr:hypothetical protein D9753_34355 [Streptomyces dangxiongensis]
MSKAGRMATYEWQAIADEFLDYLGTLSAETPSLDTPEAKAVLKDATEAAAGAVAYAAYYPHCTFQVFLDYVNFGIGYDPRDEDGADGPQESVTPAEWIDAFCLAILTDKSTLHGEAFHFAREKFTEKAEGTPAGELATGFMAQVLGDTGNDEDPYPPSAQAKLAALDAALARLRSRAEETGESLLDRPDSVALNTLRAVAAEDREAFDAGLAALLLPHTALHGPGARARTLLPLLPLGLAALAYRTLGWMPALRTPYLPHALVTGFETRGPRVEGFGRNRRPDAVAALAAGPLVVDRPVFEYTVHPDTEAQFDEYTREAFTPENGEPLAVRRLGSAIRHQELLFKWRAGNSADVTDAQLENLRLASRMGAALFRVALAEPGTETEVTIDGRKHRYPAVRDSGASPAAWENATAFALITGVREDLAPLVLTGPTVVAGKGGSAFTAYREALHAYLRGVDLEAAAERALAEAEKARDWGFFPRPAVLLSQLVEGDEESFNLALADALEAHRDYYRVGDRAGDPDAAIDLNVVALACHARRRGWTIRVESPYLPQRLLQAAERL